MYVYVAGRAGSWSGHYDQTLPGYIRIFFLEMARITWYNDIGNDIRLLLQLSLQYDCIADCTSEYMQIWHSIDVSTIPPHAKKAPRISNF